MEIREASPAELVVAMTRRTTAFGETVVSDARSELPLGRGFVGADAKTVGYAVPNPGTNTWTLEVDGPGRAELAGPAARLIAQAEDVDVTLWLHVDVEDPPGPEFVHQRTLHRMHRRLQIDEPPVWAEDIAVSGFVCGRDEDAWLALNNIAFGDHPEQGGWTRSHLERRQALPWFRADDLRMIWRGERLAASNWLKIEGTDGQIYVIAVDPAEQGKGLGRAVALEGLAHAARRGAREASLFVDASNDPGLRLYGALGFEIDATHLAYEFLR